MDPAETDEDSRFWVPTSPEESGLYAQLLDAAINDQGDTVAELADRGLNLDALFPQRDGRAGTTALHEAARRGNVNAMQSLIAHKASVDLEDYDHSSCTGVGDTPLFAATAHAQPDAIRILLQAGADPHRQCSPDWSPFAGILARRCLEARLGGPAKVTQRQADSIQVFVDQGWPLNDNTDEDNMTVMEQLVELGDMEYVRLYFDPEASNHTLLGMAARCHQGIDPLKFLIDKGLKDERGSALCAAARWGQPHMAKFLIEHGGSLPAGASRGALHKAASLGRPEMTSMLIENGISPNARDKEGITPIIMACRQSRIRIENIQILLAHGADVNSACTSCGDTALHVAMWRCDPSLLKVLLDAGADVNQQTHAGETPLMLVAEGFPLCGIVEKVKALSMKALKMLLAAGADPSLSDNKGRTALSIMAENTADRDKEQVSEATKLLEEHLAAAHISSTGARSLGNE